MHNILHKMLMYALSLRAANGWNIATSKFCAKYCVHCCVLRFPRKIYALNLSLRLVPSICLHLDIQYNFRVMICWGGEIKRCQNQPKQKDWSVPLWSMKMDWIDRLVCQFVGLFWAHFDDPNCSYFITRRARTSTTPKSSWLDIVRYDFRMHLDHLVCACEGLIWSGLHFNVGSGFDRPYAVII